jgi:hypothetical protein
MGLLTTRWEAKFDGHNITVTRNEVLRGFALEWDGVEIARRTWSWIGLGELHGTADVDGMHHDVKVAIEWGGLSAMDGKCTITVDGTNVDVNHIR